MTHQEKLHLIKLGLHPKECVPKEKKPLRKKSIKKLGEERETKELLGEDETVKEKFFQNRRREMTGTCQCGCAGASSKYDDKNFRSSICHIFPQRLFPSIQYHHLNWVERKFWATDKSSACHTNMDNKSMDLWPNFADWDDIKAKFYQLDPLLTPEEKAHKFYHHLKWLVENN